MVSSVYDETAASARPQAADTGAGSSAALSGVWAAARCACRRRCDRGRGAGRRPREQDQTRPGTTPHRADGGASRAGWTAASWRGQRSAHRWCLDPTRRAGRPWLVEQTCLSCLTSPRGRGEVAPVRGAGRRVASDGRPRPRARSVARAQPRAAPCPPPHSQRLPRARRHGRTAPLVSALSTGVGLSSTGRAVLTIPAPAAVPPDLARDLAGGTDWQSTGRPAPPPPPAAAAAC